MQNVLKQNGLEADSKPTVQWGDRALLVLALVLFIFSAHGLYFSQKPTGLDPSAIELGNLVSNGKIKRRHAKSLHWQTVSGENKVFLRDIVYTPKDSTAEFRWGNGHVLNLEPDSMVQFDEVTLDKIEIQLIEGKVKSHPNIKARMIVQKKEAPMRLLPYPKSDKFKVGIPKFELLKGELDALDVRLEKIASATLLPFETLKTIKEEKKSLTDYTAKILAPNKEKFSLARNKWIQLKWQKIPLQGITYTLEISREPSFGRFVSHQTEENTLSIQFEDAGIYYWRVKVIEAGKTLVSKVATFSMVTSPEGKVDKDSRMLLSQEAGYVTEVAIDEGFSTVIRTQDARDKKCDLTGLRLGSYFCRIKDKKTGKTLSESPVRIP